MTHQIESQLGHLLEFKDKTVEAGMVKVIGKKVPLHMVETKKPITNYYSQVWRSVPTNALYATAPVQDDINYQSSFEMFNPGFTLQFNVTVINNPVRVAPCAFWWSRIDFIYGGSVLTTIYAETIMSHILMLPEYKQRPVLRAMGLVDGSLNPQPTLATGTIVNYYLPILGSFLNTPLYWNNQSKPITVRLTPFTGGPNISGTGQLQINSISFVIENTKLDDATKHHFNLALASSAIGTSFLECNYQGFTATTLTASTLSRILLTGLTGPCAFLMVLIRSSLVNANQGAFTYTSIGPKGTMDILDASSNSIIGAGIPPTDLFLKNHIMASHFDSSNWWLRSMYLLPFCKSMREAVGGQKNGIYHLTGRENLQITPDAAEIPETQSITLGAVLTAGHYQLSWKNQLTSTLLYTATAAQIAAALNALDVALFAPNGSVVFTASDHFDNNAVVTLTMTGCSNSYPGNSDLVQFLPQSSTPATFGVTTQTQGVPGFATGAYQIDTWCFCHRELTQFRGRLAADNNYSFK